MSLLIILVVVAASFAVTFFLQNKKLKAINQQLTAQLTQETQARQKDAWRVSQMSGRGKCLDLPSLACGLRFKIRHAFYDQQACVFLVLDCIDHTAWKSPRILKVQRNLLYTFKDGLDEWDKPVTWTLPYTLLLHRCDTLEVGLMPNSGTNEKILIVTKGSVPEDELPPSRMQPKVPPKEKYPHSSVNGTALAA